MPLGGYRRRLEPKGNLAGFGAEEDCRHDVVGCFQAVGSLLHLGFAVQPELLRHFFHPNSRRPRGLDLWTASG